MTLAQDISKIVRTFGADRVRFPTNNELILLSFISRMDGEAYTGNLIHAMTLAFGKGFTFNQVTVPLKQLGRMGLITVEKVKSDASGRMVDSFKLTDQGVNVLGLAFEYSECLQSGKARRAPVEAPKVEKAVETPTKVETPVSEAPRRAAAASAKNSRTTRSGKVTNSPKRVTKKAEKALTAASAENRRKKPGEPSWFDDEEPAQLPFTNPPPKGSTKDLDAIDEETGIPAFLRRKK